MKETVSQEKLVALTKDTIAASAESLLLNQNDATVTASIVNAAKLIVASAGGRLITTGMGKSGLIARKVAATLTSTGTPSMFLHPADALHGDMGNIQKEEIVLAFSNSGETRELLELLPHIKILSGKLIAVCQKADSSLATNADASIIYKVSREGCPLNLAPMASTTSALAVADALAAVLIKLKGFATTDFGRFHPSGSLGKKLFNRVKDVMQDCRDSLIRQEQTVKQLIQVMVGSNLGAVLVTDEDKKLTGLVSDGDIKRLLDKYEPSVLWQMDVQSIMTKDPLTIQSQSMIEEALALMNQKKIYVLPVVDENKMPIGILRMHELVELI